MIPVNLPTRDEPKDVFSLRLYRSTLAEIDLVSAKSGIRKQDLVRIAINNLLDSKEVKSIID